MKFVLLISKTLKVIVERKFPIAKAFYIAFNTVSIVTAITIRQKKKKKQIQYNHKKAIKNINIRTEHVVLSVQE